MMIRKTDNVVLYEKVKEKELNMEHYINDTLIKQFGQELLEEEKCQATIEKYLRDVSMFYRDMGGDVSISKELVIQYKQYLTGKYSVSTVNGKLASINSFFKKMNWNDCIVKSLRVQRESFRSRERELTKAEYFRLLAAAKKRGDMRLYYLIQTIGATGIRVSELSFITVEAVKAGRARVSLKGKNRTVLLPAALCRELKRYIKEKNIRTGSIFITRNGTPVDRSNIFRAMKSLCKDAEVEREKVFPHNLRHLFACIYYKAEKDIAHLADILGHSSVETTRIYLVASCTEQERQIEGLGMVV